MTEDQARDWINARFGVAGVARMERFVDLVIAESQQQNLIARSTFAEIWTRHVVDSAQLVPFAEHTPGAWLDIGSGAGFPGLVVAALTDRPVTLAEPRKRRVAFLEAAADALGIAARTSIFAGKVEALKAAPVRVISARAVATLDHLLVGAADLATEETLWLLPKGQSARDEVAIARRAWHGAFHVEQSLTNKESLIVVARGVARRCKS
ncbi:16S rRNA (guanine(527)-N(7))-methyltransferase RsmG [Sphingomonas sp. NFR15]|uniref:16S rRNA (guanine(527)-N(7))-methyltransferase RsmG n=1 Tax=Sphingomonas sp. NFR15 TaxID=1566282 RepID=UPI000883FF0C|nr:16S rRNA (guanine(527)-N(7))-methyltransferase RsmG [Sphingomonas sp. NFR15]SDA33220.1 16S rRNA (guanine527-N7)-methyltransferase [Sphingomonas sp. NFR15]